VGKADFAALADGSDRWGFLYSRLVNGLEPLARGGAEELNYLHLRIRLLEDA
jgi:hypothetical protein